MPTDYKAQAQTVIDAAGVLPLARRIRHLQAAADRFCELGTRHLIRGEDTENQAAQGAAVMLWRARDAVFAGRA